MTVILLQRLQSPIVMFVATIVAIVLLTWCAILTHSLITGLVVSRNDDEIRSIDMETNRYLTAMELELDRLQNLSANEIRNRYAAALLHLDNTILNRSADHPTHDVFVLEFRYVPKREAAINKTVEDTIGFLHSTIQRTKLDVRHEFQKDGEQKAETSKQVVAIWRMALGNIVLVQSKQSEKVRMIVDEIIKAVCKYLPNACDEVSNDLEEAQQEFESYQETILRNLTRSVKTSLNNIVKIYEGH